MIQGYSCALPLERLVSFPFQLVFFVSVWCLRGGTQKCIPSLCFELFAILRQSFFL